MLSIFLVHFLSTLMLLAPLKSPRRPPALDSKRPMCSTYKRLSWRSAITMRGSELFREFLPECQKAKLWSKSGPSLEKWITWTDPVLQHGAAVGVFNLLVVVRCMYMSASVCVCVFVNPCLSAHSPLYIYVFNARAFHHICVCFCLYLYLFICSSLCHLFCLIVCVCVCVCGPWTSVCRHCDTVVYFHIHDTAPGCCVTHHGGDTSLCVYMCVCV